MIYYITFSVNDILVKKQTYGNNYFDVKKRFYKSPLYLFHISRRNIVKIKSIEK